MAIWDRKNATPVDAPANDITPIPAVEMPSDAAQPDDTVFPTGAMPSDSVVPPEMTDAAEDNAGHTPSPAPSPEGTPEPTASSGSSNEATSSGTATPSNTAAPSGTAPTKDSEKKPSKDQDSGDKNSAHGDFSVSANGQLKVKGTQLVNQFDSPIVLRGVSTAGIAWFPNFATKSFMKTLKEEWGISVFRIAMYSFEGNDSYVNNPEWNKAKVCSLIDAALELDLYVIVDWHILADGNPQTYQAQAMEFFDYIAGEYAGVPNVLYEICNEPNGNVSWGGNIKPYAQKVIPVIRKHSPDAIIIVGTPTWSQDVDVAANSPLEEENVMYALHFYAGTHKEWLRNRVSDALRKGLPIFASEWGTTDASGNGNVDTASSDEWLEFLESNQISWCNWSLCNKAESSALLLPSAGDSGAMPDSVISVSGKYVKKKLEQYGSVNLTDAAPSSKGEETENSKNPNPAPTPTPVLTPTPTTVPASTAIPADASGLVLLSYNENRTTISNTLSPRIQLQNNTEGEVSLENIVIHYYYTPESDVAQRFWCDYADVNGSTYRAITGSVKGSYRSGAKSCMEISFEASAGVLLPGEYVSLQLRFTNEDWSNYDQSDDISFLASSTSWQENANLDLILQK